MIIFHARTLLVDKRLVTAGGRVLSIAATGTTLSTAVANAYEGVESIRSDRMFYRKRYWSKVGHKAKHDFPVDVY